MKFSTEPVKKVEAKTPEVADLLAVQESIHQSWMDLDASIKQIDEVQQIMDNIDFSINAVTKYGADAIKVLNVDGSLENLLGIPEKLITAEKAVESLDENKKSLMTRFTDFVKRIIAYLKELTEKIMNYVQSKMIKWFAPEGTLDPNAKMGKGLPYAATIKLWAESYAKIATCLEDSLFVIEKAVNNGKYGPVDVCVKDILDVFANKNVPLNVEMTTFIISGEKYTDENTTWSQAGYANSETLKKMLNPDDWQKWASTLSYHTGPLVKKIDALSKEVLSRDEIILKNYPDITKCILAYSKILRLYDNDVIQILGALKTLCNAWTRDSE